MFDAELAKREYVEQLENEWRENWCQSHYKELGYARPQDIPFHQIPAPPDLAPKTWVVHRWETGGLVADYEKFSKLPQARQTKILKTL